MAHAFYHILKKVKQMCLLPDRDALFKPLEYRYELCVAYIDNIKPYLHKYQKYYKKIQTLLFEDFFLYRITN